MTLATAAAPTRFALTALLAASLAAFVVAGRADGAGRAWSAYLAPAAACPGATDPGASPAVQQRAIGCLVNWARAREGKRRLEQPASLRRASAAKGSRVASCGELSHTPCNSDLTAPVRAAGYPYASFGENLFAGTWGQVTPRDVVSAWLQSPLHRANVLRPIFRDMGAALVRAPGLFGDDADAAVWVATFASSR